ncbi:MAG: 30S ribosomal protein S9 [Omnitrophica bacterium RBG_13_46_9]|nr:MAG: 30S ribosomal protein S9 [Omnitrophica bacterium RBG_13_46_9]
MAEKEETVQKEQKEKKSGGEYIITTGRRKEAVARVYLREGTGKIVVNRRAFDDYFPMESYRLLINQPVKKVNLESKLDIFATVTGGGISSQAQALRHGIARAIVKQDAGKRSALKKAGFLTRDPRAKERKKYGRKRARKRFQYSKR